VPDITHDDQAMRKLLAAKPRISMVGASDNPSRDSNNVFRYLVARGYKVTPVNPTTPQVAGVATVPDLPAAAQQGSLGIVDVFRAPDQVMPVVDAAIAAKAPAIWFQLGVVNPPAIEKAVASGMQVVVDRCIKIEIARLGL
jgi:predicted CoA-binding protein